MMIFFSITLFISLFLFFLYETYFLIEWAQFLKISQYFPYMTEYLKIKNQGGDIKYFNYLGKANKSFLFQLVSCPICVSFWLSLIASFFVGFIYYPLINFFGLIGFFILKICAKRN